MSEQKCMTNINKKFKLVKRMKTVDNYEHYMYNILYSKKILIN